MRLFGDWGAEAEGTCASSRWLEVASAAAFGAAGLKWAGALLDMGEVALGTGMLLAVEAAGAAVGLAGSHEVMQQVRTLRVRTVNHVLAP